MESLGQLSLDDLSNSPIILSELLAKYGRHLYTTSEARYLYVEAINAVTDRYRHLKGQLTTAWDVVTSWCNLEPTTHRCPMPLVLLKAMVTAALFWQWNRVAILLLLSYFGIFRMADVLPLKRKHLIFAEDWGDHCTIMYVAIEEPKTRFRGARHQHGSVTDACTIAFCKHMLRHLDAEHMIWPFSPGLFRKRFEQLLSRLQVSDLHVTPGGLRAGGAVYAFRSTSDVATLQWRMRIKDQVTLSHYLQEVAAVNVLSSLKRSVKQNLHFIADQLPFLITSALCVSPSS